MADKKRAQDEVRQQAEEAAAAAVAKQRA